MQNTYNTIIIGAGPAGLMAGITAKRKGDEVLIIEKNDKVGRKLLITGKGRCNLTNETNDLKSLVDKYRRNPKFLYHAFSELNVQDTLKFFRTIGVETKTERGERVFPITDRAITVVDALYSQLSDNIITDCEVLDLEATDNHISKIITSQGEFFANKYILATGGKSYPLTGSDGFGYEMAKKLGHTIETLKPALVPILTKDKWIGFVQGLSLKNVELNIFQNNKKKLSQFGEMLFTHEGISGPIVIDMSREIGNLMEQGEIEIKLDLKPALDFPTLMKRLETDLFNAGNKIIANSLDRLLPKSIIPVVIDLAGVERNTMSSQLTKENKTNLLHILKEFPITPKSLDNWNRAIVTAGGIKTKEINPNTMQSKIIDNLYFAGEIIDVYGPTGGYNLQLCWSTGYLAGGSVPGQTP
jgi:predicted Rossmann fold flavoprotein